MMTNGVHRIESIRPITSDVFVVRLTRNDFPMIAGQHVTLGLHGSGTNREYSIYSPEAAPYLEFLMKVRDASITGRAIQDAKPGDFVDVSGPYGEFILTAPNDKSRKYLFIASGVGIAPFHSLIKSYPEINYTLIHGVRRMCDRCDHDRYTKQRYISCVTAEEGGDYKGRVTDFLCKYPIEDGTICYICGNNRMIAEVYDLLREKRIPSNNILTEVFN